MSYLPFLLNTVLEVLGRTVRQGKNKKESKSEPEK